MEDVLNLEEIINKLFYNKDDIVVRRKQSAYYKDILVQYWDKNIVLLSLSLKS